jgi:hypothetical protein
LQIGQRAADVAIESHFTAISAGSHHRPVVELVGVLRRAAVEGLFSDSTDLHFQELLEELAMTVTVTEWKEAVSFVCRTCSNLQLTSTAAWHSFRDVAWHLNMLASQWSRAVTTMVSVTMHPSVRSMHTRAIELSLQPFTKAGTVSPLRWPQTHFKTVAAPAWAKLSRLAQTRAKRVSLSHVCAKLSRYGAAWSRLTAVTFARGEHNERFGPLRNMAVCIRDGLLRRKIMRASIDPTERVMPLEVARGSGRVWES